MRRRQQGNIIITALFISIFLFFLSIALIWTNRQDIALSLSMEHKMKAEAAARTGAMSIYAAMRSFDKPPAELEAQMDSGAFWKVELVEIPEEGRRGKLLLLRCRGTSGPLSSYFTMHLLKNEPGKPSPGSPGRMLGFLATGEGDPAGNEAAATPSNDNGGGQGSSPQSTTAKVIYGDFELKDVNLGSGVVIEKMSANQGPLFVTGKIPEPASPLQVVAFLPVFDPFGSDMKAYGPLVFNAPAPLVETVITMLDYDGTEFAWKAIPFPIVEPEVSNPPPIAAVDLPAPKNNSWTTVATRAIADKGNSYSWRDREPGTSRIDEAEDLGAGGEFSTDVNSLVDWGSTPAVRAKRGYALHGAVAAYKKKVYSHAWEYLYTHYQGRAPSSPIPEIVGSKVTRWPCVRCYDVEADKWTTSWSSLTDSGDVKDEQIPDPDVLLATSTGQCYSRTLDTPHRLLQLESNGNVKLGEEIPGNGSIFLYQDQPYAISSQSDHPGLVDLESGKVIGFETLLEKIPEISGPVVAEIANETVQPDTARLDISSLGGDPQAPEIRTVRTAYDLSYAIDPASSVACDGDDLYTNLAITMTQQPPSFEMFGGFKIEGPPAKVLARYDGARWHILPNGLMNALSKGQASPGDEMFCARYLGLPADKSRYTVVSIDTDHFEFRR